MNPLSLPATYITIHSRSLLIHANVHYAACTCVFALAGWMDWWMNGANEANEVNDWDFYNYNVLVSEASFKVRMICSSYSGLPIRCLLKTARGCRRPIVHRPPWVYWAENPSDWDAMPYSIIIGCTGSFISTSMDRVGNIFDDPVAEHWSRTKVEGWMTDWMDGRMGRWMNARMDRLSHVTRSWIWQSFLPTQLFKHLCERHSGCFLVTATLHSMVSRQLFLYMRLKGIYGNGSGRLTSRSMFDYTLCMTRNMAGNVSTFVHVDPLWCTATRLKCVNLLWGLWNILLTSLSGRPQKVSQCNRLVWKATESVSMQQACLEGHRKCLNATGLFGRPQKVSQCNRLVWKATEGFSMQQACLEGHRRFLNATGLFGRPQKVSQCNRLVWKATESVSMQQACLKGHRKCLNATGLFGRPQKVSQCNRLVWKATEGFSMQQACLEGHRRFLNATGLFGRP